MKGGTAAVVLNYRTPEDTILAVRALQASDTGVSPIVLVDNGSRDDSLEHFARHLHDVELITLERNEGFSAGCNAGIRVALGAAVDSVLLVNGDVILPPNAVAALRDVLDASPQVGIVSPVVRSRRDPDLVESLGFSYRASTGRMRMIAHGSRVEDIPSFDQRVVDGVSGCAMLIRREVFSRAGLMRDEYFFGFEDLDFCWRARECGWLSACAGSAFALHVGSRSIGRRASARAYFATRNHLLLASRFPRGGSGIRLAGRLTSVLALNLLHAATSRDIPTVRGLAAAFHGARDFLRGRFGDPAPYRSVDR